MKLLEIKMHHKWAEIGFYEEKLLLSTELAWSGN